ncbi:quinolinate synthase NadA [Acetobacterium woodii]|uniref:Quinolinate synthase n=1 Tax=Acetobacterium woodii (strain ATCC 29683 / DSM 1030 / JCM 2381 / KCTC 1655 / WB1) TaxID=931626 RepID=H6LG39_ACEWD|nr:quinolinate synthase NadA [Acetobacterium woodii]AFA49515.1 quinolinate synthetase A [Acetobacterium woodii DSM 1030]
MEEILLKINELKKQKNAVILAHYYVNDELQEIADYVGDSYYLSKIAVTVPQDVIIFCGVTFMGESAKILNPEKSVIMPDANADCPMAHMASVEKIKAVKEQYQDLAVVCYINSTAEIKKYVDVCVTSSNALKIVQALPQKNIYFVPDENLGRYIASKLPEKNFIFNNGYCHVHDEIMIDEVEDALRAHPGAKVLVHPECTMAVIAAADYVGSTSGIIDYATTSEAEEFIICTEIGILYQLKKNNPSKKFYCVNKNQICPNMKKINLAKVLYALENGINQVEVDLETREKAILSLEKMLELAK